MIAKIIMCFVSTWPTGIHVWNDRKGDIRKTNDIIALTCGSLIAAGIGQWLGDVQAVKTCALIFGIHTAFFDYWINYELYKNKVIERPQAKRWWEYVGFSSKLDQFHPWVSIGWGGRLAVRVVVFVPSVIWFWI